MRTKLLLIAGLLTLTMTAPILAQDSTNIAGASFGMLIGPDKPAFGYSVTTQFSTENLTGPLVTGIEASAFYSDAGWYQGEDKASETYALRSFLVRDITVWGNFQAGLGLGGWTYLSSSGSDFFNTAVQARFLYRAWKLYLGLTGDVISVKGGPDRYFTAFNVNIGI